MTSVITLAPESQLALADYQYNPARGERRAVLRLLRGLVHTVVNRIIKTEEPDFIMETHTATIGVRGTDWYTLLVFAENGIEICDFLKADCEGAEYDILLKLGASSLGRIRHLCIEYHDHVGPHNHLDLVHHLQAHGFEVRCSQNPVHSNLGLLYARNQRLNAVSRPEESHGTNSNRPEGSLQ